MRPCGKIFKIPHLPAHIGNGKITCYVRKRGGDYTPAFIMVCQVYHPNPVGITPGLRRPAPPGLFPSGKKRIQKKQKRKVLTTQPGVSKR